MTLGDFDPLWAAIAAAALRILDAWFASSTGHWHTGKRRPPRARAVATGAAATHFDKVRTMGNHIDAVLRNYISAERMP